jgi:hypothetical protein
MIVQLTNSHQRLTAGFLFSVFYLSLLLPARAMAAGGPATVYSSGYSRQGTVSNKINLPGKRYSATMPPAVVKKADPVKKKALPKPAKRSYIGGPSQPEMSSFKSVGTSNMVNLFSGDFNYNIPLLDVGGYPVNIYYDGGIGMEQEASWVGLGWNINPGNINRNMRGVPDDFNGLDTLKQLQVMKPNKTWGLGLGADVELLGIKLPVKANLGVAFNNYLGPSLDLSVRGTAGLKVASFAGSEKSGANVGLNFGIDVNSRSGASFSGSVSLTANGQVKTNQASFGFGLSTGYNSRSGIKSLQIYEQGGFNSTEQRKKDGKNGEQYSYNAGGKINPGLYSTSISFAKPSYIPSMRMPLTNTAWSGHFQVGLGSFGVAADVEAEVYGQKSQIAVADTLQLKPMVGYIYAQNAMNNPAAVMDFTRFNDREVTPNTPVISVPQYSYDVFSIQGEGTGGSIRAFRNDLGYVRDNITTSKDNNLSLGGDIDPPGHYGGNFNTIKTPSTIGEWSRGNKLRNTIAFRKADSTFENVYFRNPGENCVQDSNRFNQVGGTDLVRFVLGGSGNAPTIEPALQSFSSSFKAAANKLTITPPIKERNKRTQVINFLTAAEAAKVGLDKAIRSYNNQTFLDNITDTLLYESIPRVDGSIRKAHHISQINVTENNGKRYVYGVPVYNLSQKDFTFSVSGSYAQTADKVETTPTLRTPQSGLLGDGSLADGYLQVTTTPPYAHSYLLSGILSPDYVDVTGNGISEDDLGDAVKFNYSRIKNGADAGHKWRTPLTQGDSANFNAGSRSITKDDKAIISYGERESWYVQSVESKTMIALFYVSNRSDGKGALGQNGGINTNDNFIKKLDSIALFSKADLKINGLIKSKPIKTVHFVYDYQLCQNTPDNSSGIVSSTGKLSLQNIYFTYNGKTRAFKNRYSFAYTNTAADNPDYTFAATDRWGTYKPADTNPGGLKNSDYPYVIQDTAQKAVLDRNAAAWMLKKIVLPSGGQISMTYEADDYAYVQDKRATDMMRIVGFGSTTVLSAATDQLYPYNSSGTENDYVFIKVPVACTSAADAFNKYLQGVNQLAFKIWVQMPLGPEYIPCYATYNSYGVDGTNANVIWVKLNRLGGKSPLSLTALEYLRQQLPGQAFKGYDVLGEPALKQVGDMLLGMLYGLRDAFTDPVNAFRKDNKAQHTDTSKCFVRLNDPDGIKYGGGYRVKSVILKDNWNAMTGQFTASYGQSYDYTTTESFNGVPRKISSGVASYEPSIGGDENPFQTIVQVEDYLPAGPTSYGAVEMPVLDAFFPSPSVGYSKVTVSSIKMDTAAAKKTRSGIGKQVTEYYTAKDYPVYYNYTPFDAGSVKEFHQASTLAFFNKYSYDYKAQSQGFLVATNDMHGKMKSQSSYAENDTATRINYTENFYRNTGVNGLNDKFSFISKDSSGKVALGNMGIDVDLMTDTREFSVKSNSLEVQAQVDMFWPIPVPTILPVFGESENIYRAVTTTKVVNYHSVLDSVVVIDKGSQVSTKNLAYDDQTGEVLVTRTNNEFNKAIYNTSYPAWWGYGGMGLAYKNIDATYAGINFSNGKITNAAFNKAVFESGDELLITTPSLPTTGCEVDLASPVNTSLIWAFDKTKNTTSLITTPDLIFIDTSGKQYTMNNVNIRIIRSGKRNMLDAKVAAITTMVNPLATGKLVIDSNSKVINASAAEFKEKWLADNDVIKKISLVKDPLTCVVSEVEDINGTLEKNINPYRKGLAGNFRSFRNMVFYDNRKEYDTAATTNIGIYGYLNKFKPYWNFSAAKNLVPDTASTQWVWNSRLNSVNAKGLELETVDALGIYTAAQYGYNKTMPVAIANNARYTEMFAENFEDYAYGESISNAKYNFTKKHIDFTKLSNSILVNTDTASFKAHSGKYVYAVNAGATANFDIPVLPTATTSSSFPSLLFGKDTLKVLNNLGGTYSFTSLVPKVTAPADQGTPSYGTSAFSLQIKPKDSLYTDGHRAHWYSCYDTFYVNVTTPLTYVISLGMSTGYNHSGITVFSHSNTMTINIYDELGNSIGYFNLGQNAFLSTSATFNAFLCAGKYKIVAGAVENYPYTGGAVTTSNNYNWSINGLTSPDYKDLNTVNGCIFDKPIAGKDSIINPLFSIPTAKKMVFSGWIREICGDAANGVPCKDYTYTHNQVQLNFAGFTSSNVMLNPTGAIVEGWQRYEGTFTAPAGATSCTMNFVNSGTGKMYLDDIRIHPFNANMKSYVYDPVNLRLVAEQDANNYSSFYEYDEEGTLIRTKVETREGVKTVNETRSSLQKVIQ